MTEANAKDILDGGNKTEEKQTPDDQQTTPASPENTTLSVLLRRFKKSGNSYVT